MWRCRPLKEFNIKGCREVRFSRGGASFAATNGTTVHVYATYTCELLGVIRCVLKMVPRMLFMLFRGVVTAGRSGRARMRPRSKREPEPGVEPGTLRLLGYLLVSEAHVISTRLSGLQQLLQLPRKCQIHTCNDCSTQVCKPFGMVCQLIDVHSQQQCTS